MLTILPEILECMAGLSKDIYRNQYTATSGHLNGLLFTYAQAAVMGRTVKLCHAAGSCRASTCGLLE